MPKINSYLIKENYKKVEEVREIENEYPSYEEFMKNYEPSEEVEILTEAEYQDRLLHGPQFGPGNEQSKKTAAGVGIGVGLAATTFVNPALGAKMIKTYAVGGILTQAAGGLSGNDELRQAGEVVSFGTSVGKLGSGEVPKKGK